MPIPTEKEELLIQNYYKFSIPGQPAVLAQEMAKRNYGRIKVLALDLEHTLITDIFTCLPRPGLNEFLESVKNLFGRIVIFTAVSKEGFRDVAKTLIDEYKVYSWFADLEYIEWPREGKKDLSYISGIEPHEALLVDDQFGYIQYSQLFSWIKIEEYDSRRRWWDFELNRVLGILEMIMLNQIKKETVLAFLNHFIDDDDSGIKRAWLYGDVAKGRADAKSVIKIALEIDQDKDAERLRIPLGTGILQQTEGVFERYFWTEVELVSYPEQDSELKKKIDDGIMITNSWELFNVVFTRTQEGIDIIFPDLSECQGFCPDDGGDHFSQFTIQAIEPARDALQAYLKDLKLCDMPGNKLLSKKEIKRQYPDSDVDEIWVQLPWRKNNA